MDELNAQKSISLKDTKEVTCSCGSSIFAQAASLREVSSLVTGTGKTEYVPVAVLVCYKCDKLFERLSLITT